MGTSRPLAIILGFVLLPTLADAQGRPSPSSCTSRPCVIASPVIAPVVAFEQVFTLERRIYAIVRVLEPIDPAEVDYDPERLMARTREVMESGLEQLRAEIEARGGLEAPPPGYR